MHFFFFKAEQFRVKDLAQGRSWYIKPGVSSKCFYKTNHLHKSLRKTAHVPCACKVLVDTI